jgi:hypothetical protein
LRHSGNGAELQGTGYDACRGESREDSSSVGGMRKEPAGAIAY